MAGGTGMEAVVRESAKLRRISASSGCQPSIRNSRARDWTVGSRDSKSCRAADQH